MNMVHLGLKLILQSYTRDKIHKFNQSFDVCEILILEVLLKKITQYIVKSLCANLFHVKKNFAHKDFLIGIFS